MAADLRDSRGDLPSISVRRPILAIVANLLIVLAGVAAILGVEVRELPEVERPRITITADYPGASPETVDAEVTRALEGAAARVAGVRSISSQSEEGGARIVVTFASSVDIDDVAGDAREAVSDVRRRLPDGVESVFVVKADDEADPILRLAVWSDTLDREALSARIDDTLVPELASVPGVADVQVNGLRERTLTVVVDPLRLASYGLSIADVEATLADAPVDVPAGSLETSGQNLLIRADASVVTEEAIERLVIRGTTRIGDVASAFFGPEEASSEVRWNGREVVGLGVVRQPSSNTVEISGEIRAIAAALDRRLTDIELAVTADNAVFITGALREVATSLVLGVAIVVAVILVFIGSPRLTLIPAVAIPVALVGTVAAIWLLGFSINILTLLALVLATGILVDDAIVVLENIARVRARGYGPLAAAVVGTRQVFFAVIATTAVLVSVFVPIAFLPGRAGQLFTEFGIVLAIAVCLSSFVALTLCPMLASKLVPAGGEPSPGPLRRGLAAVGRAGAALYARVLRVALAIPLVVIAVLLAVAGGVGSLVTSLERELVPEEDRGVIVVWLIGPDGVGLEYTDRQVRRAEAALEPLVASGEVQGVYAIVGRYDPNLGYVVAPLAPWDERRPQAEIVAELRTTLDRLPGARVFVRSPNSLNLRSGGGGELEAAVTGADYATIAAAGDRLVAAIARELPGLTSPSLSFSTTQPQLSVRIDRERAADLGVDIDGVAATLEAMVDGAEAARLDVGDETVPIRIESRAGEIDDSDDLRNLFVAAGDRVLPLSAFVTIEETGIAAELEREGQRRAIELEAGLVEGYELGEAAADLRALAGEVLPAGTELVLLGEAEALAEAQREALVTFALALVVVMLVLAAQFESFTSAAVVMVTVPFGLAAAILALWLTGTSLNVYSQIGLVMLIGLMAKNGILVVEFADQLRDRGWSVADAAREAAVVRLRAVTMTLLSTTLAAVPLILASGAGAEARAAIGWVVFGGLGIAILATLITAPVAYRLLAPLAPARAATGAALDAELREAPAP